MNNSINNNNNNNNTNNNNTIAINYSNNNCCADNDINSRSEIRSSKTTQPFNGGSIYPSPMMSSCRLEYYRKPSTNTVDEMGKTSPVVQRFTAKKRILDETFADVAFENQSFFGSSSGRSNQQSVIKVASKRMNFDNNVAGGLKAGSFTAGLECMEQSVFPALRVNSGCQVEQLSGVLSSNQQLQIQTNLRGYEVFRDTEEVFEESHNPLNSNNNNLNSNNYGEGLKPFTNQKSRQSHPYFQGLQYYQQHGFNTPQELQQLQHTSLHYYNNNEEMNQNSCCYESANTRPSCLVNAGYQGLDGGVPPDQRTFNSLKVQQNSVIQSIGCSYNANHHGSLQMSPTFSPCTVRPVSNSSGPASKTSFQNRGESNSAPLMASSSHDKVNKDLIKVGHRLSTLSEPELSFSDVRGDNPMTTNTIPSKIVDSTFPSSRDHLSSNGEKEEIESQANGCLVRSMTQNKTETDREFPKDITFAFDTTEFRPQRHQGTLNHYHDSEVAEGHQLWFSHSAGRVEQNLFRAGPGCLNQGTSLSRMLMDDDYFDFLVGETGMICGYNPHCAMVAPNCDANC